MSGLVGRPSRSDVALAAGLAGATVAELFAPYAFEHTATGGPSGAHVAFAVVAAAALAWRRVLPLLVAPVVLALLAVQPLVVPLPNTYGEVVIAVVAVYSVTAYAPSPRTAAAAGAVSLALAATLGLWEAADPVGQAVTNVVFGAVVLLAGAVVRRQRDRADEMRRQRDRADARAAEIAATERARIARELHDVVAHGMSVVVLQARGARRVLDRDRGAAARALEDIERIAAACLDEMRRLLGLLRSGELVAASLAPQPTLRELTGLVEQARESGVPVELVVDGQRRDLPAAVELSAYRIVQEALTNTLKHAPGSKARVRLGYEADALAIAVTDDGPTKPDRRSPEVGGHGLIGMRERAELFGGTFTAGPQPDGGFGVHARLPLAGSAP